MLTALILATAFMLQSPDFANGGTMPQDLVNNSYGCTGQNRAPTLRWTGVPKSAKELALTVWDPDAKAPGGWVHWTVFHIPASWKSLSIPLHAPALSGLNSFGSIGYGGPCPPVGDPPHHYIFTLDALNARLPVSATTTYAQYQAMRYGRVIASARLVGRFGRR